MKRVIKSSREDVIEFERQRLDVTEAIVGPGPDKVMGKTWKQLIENLEDSFELKVDGADRQYPSNWIYAYAPDGSEFEIEVTEYYNGDYEIVSDNINATGGKSNSKEFRK